MILITGATGFVGQALLRHLSELEQPVRILLRPSKRSPRLPQGQAVEAAICRLQDEQALRLAMVGIETVYHLASSEQSGLHGDMGAVDLEGTQAVCQAARAAGVKRLFYLSHLGAERGSAYHILKIKGIAEEYVRRSGVPYTIVRSAMAYGLGDHFTSRMIELLRRLPFFLMPDDGDNLLQPIWIEDLATCLTWALDDRQSINQTVEIGGPEFLNLRQVTELVMAASGKRRPIVNMHAGSLKVLTLFAEQTFYWPRSSVFWLEYLASNRTCELDALPRLFSLAPSRFSQRLDYLKKARKR